MNKPAAENDDFSAFLYENQDTPFSPIIETPKISLNTKIALEVR
jgi:hypothetical protein